MNRSCEDRIVIRMMDLYPNCLELAIAVFEYVIPVIALFVTIVNILVIVVFLRPTVRSHTTMILSFIACADIAGITCPAVVFIYHYSFEHYKELLTCIETKLIYIFGEIFPDMFSMLSLYLTVLLAFIRCKCIKSPFVAKSIHSLKRLTIYITGICALVLVIHVPSFFLFDFKTVKFVNPETNLTSKVCGVLETEGIYLKSCSRRKFHVLLETLMDSVLPCVVLVFYNLSILFTLRKASQSRSSLRLHELENNGIPTNDDVEKDDIRLKENLHYESINMNLMNKTLSDEKKKYENENIKKDNASTTDHFGLLEKKDVNAHLMRSCTNLSYRLDDRDMNSKKGGASFFSDHTIDRLDNESRRTSWMILVVSTLVVVHEIPLAIVNTYTLATYTNKPLPLTMNGCFSVVQTLWQFMTYPMIFLIYVCMSKAFRSELCKSFITRSDHLQLPDSGHSFVSPCLVRKFKARNGEIMAGPEQDESFENEIDGV